jgi:acyl carrier protein
VTCNDHSDDITRAVIEEIAAELRQPADQIPLDARLDAGELGIDSLGLIKLTVRLEERFDITMPDLTAQEAVTVASVRDVVALVARQIAVKGGAR